MKKLTIPQAKEFAQHVAFRHGEAVMWWGAPGVGKTAAAVQLADDMGAYLCKFHLSQYGSIDLRGALGVREDRTVWFPPATLPFEKNADRFPTEDPILLFLDEINAATKEVSAVAMQLLHEKRIGEHVLMPNVVVLAAGNRESDRGVANRMPTTVGNRLTHAEVVADPEAYRIYRQGKGCTPEELAFYLWKPEHLFDFQPNRTDPNFATPRSSEVAWTYYQDPDMPLHTKKAAMEGAVGEGINIEIWGFLDIWRNVVPIESIIADPEHVAVPQELSLQYATVTNVSSHMDVKNIKPLTAYLDRFTPEMAIIAWRTALQRDPRLHDTQSFIHFAKKYGDLCG
jgi:hypothetical protein